MQNKIWLLGTGVLVAVLGYIFFSRQIINTPIAPSSQRGTPSEGAIQIAEESPNPTCTGQLTPPQTEGPYYKRGSPPTTDLSKNVEGEKIIITGYVFNSRCLSVYNAKIDFWQADANGVYDNQGFKLRGHQFTDADGKYQITTVIPGAYESRPPHIHVKISAGEGQDLTTQLYFPNQVKNQTDSIFNPDLVIKLTGGQETKLGEFNFVLSR